MAKVAVTWLGDEDPSQQVIEQYGHVFVKGEPTEVDENDPKLGKFRSSSVFSLSKDAKPVESQEPAPVDPDEGTELAAVRGELDALRVKYDGRLGLDALRAKLASEKAKSQ